MMMPEAGMRTLLHQLADTEAPPDRFDVQQAITRGVRVRRWRRIRACGSAVAVGVAVALLVLPVQQALNSAPPSAGNPRPNSDTAPEQFSVLVPYASFGWLPPEYQLGGQGGTWSRSQDGQLILFAETHTNSTKVVMLTVYPAGECMLAGKQLPCSAYNTEWQVLSRAPDVAGHQAYWLKGGQGLAWEYAPGAWAEMDWGYAGQSWPPRGAERASILRAAASIRYGQTTQLVFPYWLAGLPSGWQLAAVQFSEVSRPRSGLTLTLAHGAPGHLIDGSTDTIEIDVEPASPQNRCSAPGTVSLDGGSAAISTDGRFLCATLDGLSVGVVYQTTSVSGKAPDPAAPGGVLDVARRLHLLGADPADWTTSPLR